MCAYMYRHACAHNNMTAVRKPVCLSNHNHHINQTLQAGIIILKRYVQVHVIKAPTANPSFTFSLFSFFFFFFKERIFFFFFY